MASFFSLGAGTGGSTAGGHHPLPGTNPDTSWFHFRHQEENPNPYRGLELWHPNPNNHHEEENFLHLGHPIHDLFAAPPPEMGPSLASRGFVMVRGAGGVSCQDCGNQAKKDCGHMRCRTCCKSRGFECPTHVKSTWVPAAKRRERQRQLAAVQRRGTGWEIGRKRQREEDDANNDQEDSSNAGYKNYDNKNNSNNGNKGSSSLLCAPMAAGRPGQEVGNFPPEVSSVAVFRCVRVGGAGGDHCAYRAAVSISGHVFQGILYDQGTEIQYMAATGETSSGSGAVAAAGVGAGKHLNLITGPSTTASSPVGGGSALPFMDPSLYTPPINSFLDGTQFFLSPKS